MSNVSLTQLKAAITKADTDGKAGITSQKELDAFYANLAAQGLAKHSKAADGSGETVWRIMGKIVGDDGKEISTLGLESGRFQAGLTKGDFKDAFGGANFTYEQLVAKLTAGKADTPETADAKTTDTAMNEDASKKYLEDLESKLSPDALAKFKASTADPGKPIPDEQINALLAANNLQFKDGYKLPEDAKSDGVELANAIKNNTVSKTEKTSSQAIKALFTEQKLKSVLGNDPLTTLNFTKVTTAIVGDVANAYNDPYKATNGEATGAFAAKRNQEGYAYFDILRDCVGAEWYKAALIKYEKDHNLTPGSVTFEILKADKTLTADYVEQLFLSVVPCAIRDANGNYSASVDQIKTAGFLGEAKTTIVPPAPTSQMPEVKTTAGKDNSKTVDVGQA